MARRGAWRSRTRKASPPGAEGGLSDGGHAVAGPGRWCSASTASPPTSPRSRSWREIPFLPAAWLLPDFQRLLPAADALRTGQAPQGCRRWQLWRGRRAHHRPPPPPRLPPTGWRHQRWMQSSGGWWTRTGGFGASCRSSPGTMARCTNSFSRSRSTPHVSINILIS